MLAYMVMICVIGTTPAEGLKAPLGFAVGEFAGSDLANDISCMTVDGQGRVIVAGRGYIRHLIDDNGDGRADRAVELVPGINGAAMGLLSEGSVLFAVVDGGLWRFKFTGDGESIVQRELMHRGKTASEHHAHAIRRGPDGWLYWLCGNETGVDATWVTSSPSPIREPVAGCVVRFSPDFAKCEIVADGFRNAYGFDFNPSGDLFTYDSDNERCVGLPWYEGCRLYQVVPGGHYGWLSPQRCETWRLPPYMPDVVPPLLDLGRGSPTGVVCYRHEQFPAEYRNGLFLGDWTFGKIYHVMLSPCGSTYSARATTFLEPVGANGFAPTALAVDPTSGDLVIAIGGRGTRGAVYRVRYSSGVVGPKQIANQTQTTKPRSAWNPPSVDESLRLLAGAESSAAQRLQAIRAIQLALGGIGAPIDKSSVWEGYSPARDAAASVRDQLVAELCRIELPERGNFQRELTRTLAMLQADDPNALASVADLLSPESHPLDDLHNLIVIARLNSPRSSNATNRVAKALINLDCKIALAKLNRDLNWPLRVGELFSGLVRKDAALSAALLADPGFGRPDHALFADQFEGLNRRRAADVLTARAEAAGPNVWTPGLLKLLDALPADQRLRLARQLYNRGGFEEQLLPLLAKEPSADDRAKFRSGLRSPQTHIVRTSLEALQKLPITNEPDELLALLRALRAAPDGKDGAQVRELAARLLQQATGVKIGVNAAVWSRQLPELTAKLGGADGVDITAWNARLDKLDWTRGDAERGRSVFAKASCATCHSAAHAVGPDLNGITNRFSQADLMAAILQPSKDVSPRYRMMQIQTTDGKTYQGLILYESVDGLILQTGPAATVRLTGDRIESRRLSELSLMPAGLLDRLDDCEIADLIAYLRTLRGKP